MEPQTTTWLSLNNFLNHDMFQHHRANVGNCCQWSRYPVAGRRPAVISAVSISSERELFDLKIQPFIAVDPQVQLMKTLTEVENTKAETKCTSRQQELCKELPVNEVYHEAEHLEELKQNATQQSKIQNNKLQHFGDLSDLPDEVTGEVEVKPKEKSVRRRLLNFLDAVVHDHCIKKIERTFQRELEEGDQLYLTNFYFFHPMTRATREQQKRRLWVTRDNKRQQIKNQLDVFWEVKHLKKEAQRMKEEECYEKWATEHGISDDSPSNEPKKRMTKWKKRFLRAKKLFL